MRALLIDHDDSFTQNLKHWLKPLFQEIHVINHLQLLEAQSNPGFFKIFANQFDVIVLSPGPKSPQDYPHTLKMLKALQPATAVYGVCLGLQLMVSSCQHTTSVYTPPKHGKTSPLQIQNPYFSIFENLNVARYHSIKIDHTAKKSFEIIAESKDDNYPMWVRHKTKKWMAVQFHPESFLTERADLHLDFLKKWIIK